MEKAFEEAFAGPLRYEKIPNTRAGFARAFATVREYLPVGWEQEFSVDYREPTAEDL